jgi:hypothetical protein
MPRINRTLPGTSYPNPALKEQSQDRDGYVEPDLDTANRLRESRERGPMHEGRGSESDARNLPRTDTSDFTYRRGTNLDAPEPRPGYVQRWVRAEFRSETDNLNWLAKMREGWAPRDPTTVADHENWYVPGRHQDKAVIRVGGMVLMEIDERRLRAKRKAIDDQTKRQTDAVARDLESVSREGMREGASPIVREERVDVRTGRRPPTLAN